MSYSSRLVWNLSSVLTLLALAAGTAASAHAMGRGPQLSQAEMSTACQNLARTGFSETRHIDWSKIPAASNRYEYVMPVNFVALNEHGWLRGSFDTSDAKQQLRNLRDTYHQCGIEPVLHHVKLIDGPDFLNVISRNRGAENELSDEERCLMGPNHTDNEINVYFVEGVYSFENLGRSHTYNAQYLLPSQPGDERYIGTCFVTTYDRSSFSRAAPFVVPHEVGHAVMNMGHVYDNSYNIMADTQQQLAYVMTESECEAARASPFVHHR